MACVKLKLSQKECVGGKKAKKNYKKELTMAKKSVKLYTDDVLSAFYEAIRTNKLDRHIFPIVMCSMYDRQLKHTMEKGSH